MATSDHWGSHSGYMFSPVRLCSLSMTQNPTGTKQPLNMVVDSLKTGMHNYNIQKICSSVNKNKHWLWEQGTVQVSKQHVRQRQLSGVSKNSSWNWIFSHLNESIIYKPYWKKRCNTLEVILYPFLHSVQMKPMQYMSCCVSVTSLIFVNMCFWTSKICHV